MHKKSIIKIFVFSILISSLFLSSKFNRIFATQDEGIYSIDRVLFISSYSPSFPTFSLQIDGLKSVLDETKVEIKIEYMDSKIFYLEESMKYFYDMMVYKLSHSEPYDVLVVADDNALQFALDYQEELFNDLPIVFLGINDLNRARNAEERENITGVVEYISMKPTLELALKINDNAKEIIALVDSTETGVAELEIFNEAVKEFTHIPSRVLNLGDYTFEEMAIELERIDPEDVVVLLSFYRDKTGKTITYHEVYHYVVKHANFPVYRLYTEGLGHGFLGGKLVSHFEQGRSAGSMVQEILEGKDADDIPVLMESPNVYMFDYQVMKKFNISESLLPSGAIIINKKPTFYEEYTALVWISGITFIFLSFVSVFLSINTMRRKRAEKELLESHEQLTALYEELEASDEELRNQFDIIQESRQALIKSKDRYKYIFSASNDGLWDIDVESKEIYLSSDWYKTFFDEDFDLSRIQIEDWLRIVHPEDLHIVEKMKEQLQNHYTKKITIEYRVIDSQHNVIWIRQTSVSFYDREDNLLRVIGSHSDITERKLQENKILNLAYRDSLTGLPNRTALQEKLTELLHNKKKPNGAIMFLDVDNFKYINDTYGHITGDKILIEIANRLLTLSDDKASIFRFGGDEFIVLLNNENDLNKVKNTADSIIGLFQKEYFIGEQGFYLTTSIGIALYPFDGNEPNDLVKNADSAMYKAKDQGKSQYLFFNKSMNQEVYDKMYIYNNLRAALENNEFLLYYQPQIDTKTGLTTGFEALIRWNSKEYGFVPPLKFIKIAEESDMIIKIGNWVLKEACIFAKKVNEQSERPLVISINISSVQLIQDNFIDTIESVIDEVGVEPLYIGIEITETALMKSFEANAEKIRRLQKLGIKTALDDFGTGYSSLNYLRQLPINTLKIDKSFVDDLLADKDLHNLTEDIIMISQKLGLKVVAEGVELEEQYELLSEYNCDIIQGYLISRPLPQDEAIQYLDYRKI